MRAAHAAAVAYLFGSRAGDAAGPASDHDVAVLFVSSEPPFGATERLDADLATVLGTRVDVVDLARATLELRGVVAESGRLLFSVDERLARAVREGGLEDLDAFAVRIAALAAGDDDAH